ncbi:MAG: beta-L-arabinofuranosidase domain-containing protein, partial [Candidatus Latescibacterota bacterium]
MDEMRTDMRPADIDHVCLSGAFWGLRTQTNRTHTLGTQYDRLVETGRIAALDPEYRPGDAAARHIFWDSDVAKWLEAACCALRAGPDAELAACVESTIDLLGRLQREDGYLNSW